MTKREADMDRNILKAVDELLRTSKLLTGVSIAILGGMEGGEVRYALGELVDTARASLSTSIELLVKCGE